MEAQLPRFTMIADLTNEFVEPIREVSHADKAMLPVCIIAPGGRRQPLVVCRYGDLVWDFSPLAPQKNLAQHAYQLRWEFQLPDGSYLTDSQNQALLSSSRDLVYTLWTSPAEGRKHPKPLTLISKAICLRELIRWMNQHGFTRFQQVQGHLEDFVSYSRVGVEGQQRCPSTHAKYLAVVEDIYHLRSKLIDAIWEHPWPDSSASELAGVRGGKDRSTTLTIPDIVVRKLMPIALEYVQRKANLILALRDDFTKTRGQALGITAESVIEDLRPPQIPAVDGGSGYFRIRTVLEQEQRRLRTACYIVIAFFSGMRDSEIKSLEVGCATRTPSWDESYTECWVHGSTYKLQEDEKAHRWLVPPVVVDAIEVLTEVTAPLRETLNKRIEKLNNRRSQQPTGTPQWEKIGLELPPLRKIRNTLFLTGIWRNTPRISAETNQSTRKHLRLFAKEFQVFGAGEEHWPLAPHQFRRTFAKFMAGHEMGDVHYLKEHFCHVSVEMTLAYAAGATDKYAADSDLLDLIVGEKQRRQRQIIRSCIEEDLPLANGNWLSDLRPKVKTAEDREEFIREIADSITLNGTGHSWCVGSSVGHGCGGLCAFEPDLCVDCPHGVIGFEHLAVWKEIGNQQEAVLHSPDIGEAGKVRSRRILAKAHKVIKLLEVKWNDENG